jgi:outer membrane protein
MRQLALLPLVVCVYSAGSAQIPVAQAQPLAQHIVTLNFSAAVIQTVEAQKDFSSLQETLAPRQAALKALSDEVEGLRKQLQSTTDKLSDAERVTRTQSLETKERQLQRQAEDFKNDSQNQSQQAFQRVAQKVFAFLETYSQQRGYSAVIERGSETAPIVWYAAANVDITDELIKAYDLQAGVPPASKGPAHPEPHDSPAHRTEKPPQR